MEPISAQVVLGAAFAYILQWLKKASWFPVLTEQSSKGWKVTVSAIVAAATAASIDLDWQQAQGVLTISGLTWDHTWNALIAFGVSWLSQHASYELLVKAPSAKLPAVTVPLK